MKNILIIGGSAGIGQALANRLSDEGNTVYATYHSRPTEHPVIRYSKFDVRTDALDVNTLPEALHGLVYCPGSISLRPFNRITAKDFADDYDFQVGGFVRVLQAVLPKLKFAGSAAVVSFSSVAAGTGLSFHTQVAATKSALEGLTRALAAEYAPGIRFNCIAPSLTDTPLAAGLLSSTEKREANAQRHPLKSIGSPEDIANAARYLLSDESRWVTGQVLHVDGGISTIK